MSQEKIEREKSKRGDKKNNFTLRLHDKTRLQIEIKAKKDKVTPSQWIRKLIYDKLTPIIK